MIPDTLYHISEESGIPVFEPRPSPSFFPAITADVVFAISENLLHNYLLPRDCPRVTYYEGPSSTAADREKFFGQSTARYIIAIESGWLSVIQQTTVYCYEMPPETFILLDECAGYYISYEKVYPVSVRPITNLPEALLKRNIELRFIPSITALAGAVQQSSLHFSLIRMRHAISEKKQ